MAINDINVHPGMRVYGNDGAEIGTVQDVYPNLASQGRVKDVSVSDADPNYGPSSPEGYRAAGPAPEKITGDISSSAMPDYYGITPGSVSPRTVAQSMYMRVESGGVLGLGAKSLYVPYSAIAEVVPDDRVVLECSRDECTGRYAEKPDFL